MTHQPLREIIRDNVKTLLSKDKPLGPGETGIMRLKALGFSNGTSQRIIEGTTNIGLEVLDELAARLGVSAWRLLQPAALTSPPECPDNGNMGSLARTLATLAPEEQAAVRLVVTRMASGRKRARQFKGATPQSDA